MASARMNLEEYARYDAVGLADLIRRGEVTRDEVVNTAAAAINAVNPKINAVLDAYRERAPKALESGPFYGVPFLRKDIVIREAWARTEFGSRLGARVRMPNASELLLRYKRAGFIVIGRTATPEFGFNAATENRVDGPTRSPWNLERGVGGSSGGAAAIVAAGAVPAANGNDGGGSLRIPAACCGVFGLKPTRGRITLGPDEGYMFLGLTVEHVITRTVRDSAAILDATHGPMPGDPFVIAPPERPYAEEIGAPGGRLKIAYTTKSWTGADVDPELVAAVDRTAKLCADLGHEVVQADLKIDAEAFDLATKNIWCAFLARSLDHLASVTLRKVGPDTVESGNLACYEHGKTLTAVDLCHTVELMNQVCREVGEFFTGYDMLLTPTIAQRVAPIGALNANAPGLTADTWIRQIFTYAPFTSLFNMTGQPAISVPLEEDSDRMPIGIQFVGRFGDEGRLLRLAAALEQARPWKDRRPPIWAGSAG